MRIDKLLWVALVLFGASMGVVIRWLAEHHGTAWSDPLMTIPVLVAIVSLNVAYWRMSKLTHGWRDWG